MRKLIEATTKNLVECDKCDYVVPNPTGDINEPIWMYLGKPCPKCGHDLLTWKDYEAAVKLKNAVNWLNKWFSWLTLFYPKSKKRTKATAKAHNGITIKVE